MPLSAVLFDLDDTLHDKSQTLNRVGRCQFEEHGLAKRGIRIDSWLERFIDLNNQRIAKTQVFSALAAQFNLPSELEQCLMSEFDAGLGAQAVPCSGARELLSWCRAKGMKVGIVTNGRDAFQRSKIAGMGFAGLADSIVTSGGFGSKKPDLAIFRACLDELSVHPKHAAFVGDDYAADMVPASELGMLAVWRSDQSSPNVAFSSESLHDIHRYLSEA
jgi:putative hydrolase of the HAD superfamily